MKKEYLFKLKYKRYRLTHWEFWPIWAVYSPCVFYYIWISLKSRSFGFFKAVNPAIPYGGMILEDKNFVNHLIAQNFRTFSFFVGARTDLDKVLQIITENNLSYPVILKPNNGCRGRNVELIKNQDQLEMYLQTFGHEDVLLEEYVDFPYEIGVFYIRIPNTAKGFISGIVEKKGITVLGDGEKSLRELVKYNFRYHRFYPDLFENNNYDQDYIPKDNEEVILSHIGNHSRGAIFYNSSYRISSKLENLFDEICSPIDGFYYGRFDVKFNSWKELEDKENFKIIELNGAASEPTFMYDPENHYFLAIKEIMRHWDYMYQIAKINKQKGHYYLDRNEYWSLFRKFSPF